MDTALQELCDRYPQLAVSYDVTTDNLLVVSEPHDVGFAITAKAIEDGVWRAMYPAAVLKLEETCARLDAGETRETLGLA